MVMAFIDFKKAFDLIHHVNIVKFLRMDGLLAHIRQSIGYVCANANVLTLEGGMLMGW